jgi:hypothetical protein
VAAADRVRPAREYERGGRYVISVHLVLQRRVTAATSVSRLVQSARELRRLVPARRVHSSGAFRPVRPRPAADRLRNPGRAAVRTKSGGLKPVRKCHLFVGRRIGYSTYVMNANDTRYVLAIGEDAPVVESAEGVAIIERSPGVVLVEADAGRARALAAGGEYVHIYRSPADAHRAFALFEQTA